MKLKAALSRPLSVKKMGFTSLWPIFVILLRVPGVIGADSRTCVCVCACPSNINEWQVAMHNIKQTTHLMQTIRTNYYSHTHDIRHTTHHTLITHPVD
jgi:hypothetical protein